MMYILSHASPDEVLAGKTTATTITSGFAYAAFAVQGRFGPMSLRFGPNPIQKCHLACLGSDDNIVTRYARIGLFGHVRTARIG